MENQSNGGELVKNNKKNNNIIYIIIAIVLIIALVTGYFIFKTRNNIEEKPTDEKEILENDNKENKENDLLAEYTFNLFDTKNISKTPVDTSELTNNIEIYDMYFNPKYQDYGKYRYVYVYGKNNNSQMILLNINFEYYDKEGYRIEKQVASGHVYGNSEFVLDTTVLDDTYDYATVKITYEAKKIKSYEKEVPITSLENTNDKLNDDNIKLTIKNNYNNSSEAKYVFISAACIYYKDGKVVFATNGSVSDIQSGKTGEITFHEFKLKLNSDYNNPQKIEYDDYKTIIYSAYYSDDTNY